MNLSMGQGVIIKSGRALEYLGQVDHVFIDKTELHLLSLPVLTQICPPMRTARFKN